MCRILSDSRSHVQQINISLAFQKTFNQIVKNIYMQTRNTNINMKDHCFTNCRILFLTNSHYISAVLTDAAVALGLAQKNHVGFKKSLVIVLKNAQRATGSHMDLRLLFTLGSGVCGGRGRGGKGEFVKESFFCFQAWG